VNLTDNIKASISLVEEFRRDGHELRKVGLSWVCLCPFHQERTPSCYLTPDKGRFHCFGCTESGSIIDYHAKKRGITPTDAIKELAARVSENGAAGSNGHSLKAKPQPNRPDVPDRPRALPKLPLLYKGSLRDLGQLARLRYLCFIAQYLREIPETEEWKVLLRAEFDLAEIVEAIRQIAHSDPRLTTSLRFAAILDKAYSDLAASLQHQDLRQLQQVARAIKSVLAVESPKTNRLLIAAARSIKFSDVAPLMAALLEAKSARAEDSERAAAMQRGYEAMRQLDEIIQTNTKELELLQEIDTQMRLLDADILHDLTSVELLWPQIRHKIDELSSLPANPRYVALTKGAQDFDAALSQTDIRKKIASFRQCNSQVGIALYFATTELYRVCQNAEDLLSSASRLAEALRRVNPVI
jgi:DNA primase